MESMKRRQIISDPGSVSARFGLLFMMEKMTSMLFSACEKTIESRAGALPTPQKNRPLHALRSRSFLAMIALRCSPDSACIRDQHTTSVKEISGLGSEGEMVETWGAYMSDLACLCAEQEAVWTQDRRKSLLRALCRDTLHGKAATTKGGSQAILRRFCRV